MTCNCINKVNEEIKNDFLNDNNNGFTEFIGGGLNVEYARNNKSTVRIFPIEYRARYLVNGKVKHITCNIIHTYCPFCGVKYKD